LVASAFPIAFLSNPLVYVFLRICLLLESTGICHGAWVLASIHKKIAGFKRDEVYIGTAEERAARKKGDNASVLRTGPGHPIKLPALPQMHDYQEFSLGQINALEHELEQHKHDVEEKLRLLDIQKQFLLQVNNLESQRNTQVDELTGKPYDSSTDDHETSGDENNGHDLELNEANV
jgi:hypothetical protein